MQVPPLRGELTASWMNRLAHTYRLPLRDLVRGLLTHGVSPPGVVSRRTENRELFFNAAARAAVTAFTRNTESDLADRLPAWNETHWALDNDDHRPRAVWLGVTSREVV
jgi:hypothetical protein